MRTPSFAAALAAGFVSLAVVAACVGDEPFKDVPPAPDGGGANDGASGPSPGSDAGNAGDGQTPAKDFCSTVAPAANAKETVFCEDFETDYAPRWDSSSEGGTLATLDADGSKVLDVTLNATPSGNDWVGPRLLWRKIPSGGSAEVSFDFSLVEVPSNLTDTGLLWFGRIGALGWPSIGFGGALRSGGIDYTAIASAGLGEDTAGPTITFAPKQWTRATIRYTSKAVGADHYVSVGTNTPHAGGFASGDVALGPNDVVFLGAFVRFAPAALRVRFDNVVIRATAP